MKKIFLLIGIIGIGYCTYAQTGEAKDTIAKPVITAVGKPDGAKTAIKINKGGSSLQSSDGIIELIIPEGAVPKNTTISIQPITNLMANGNGKAYRLEPSGIQFKKPLQLIFHYDEEEIKDSMQLLAGIAMQDNSGQWLSLKNLKIDTVAKTISGNIKHFSDWANFMKIKLYPFESRLKVKKIMPLAIDLISSEDDELVNLTPAETDDLAPLKKKRKKMPFTTTWMANGIVNGNLSTTGKIHVGNEKLINYEAPATLPRKNPVDITADLKGLSYTTKVNGMSITLQELHLNSKILVYDNAYEVTIVHKIKELSNSSEIGAANYTDTGSCVISINGKDSKIIEKVNKNTHASLNYSGKCIVTQLKSGAGTVHIIGAQSIKIIPPESPDGNAWVAIEFIKAPTILPLLNFKCPPVGGHGDWYTGNNATANSMAALIMQAYPQRIKFEAKEGEQTILEINDSTIEVKITVKKLKEE
ncbi:MAG: hypothetical protein ABI091_27500 [Ferruginibacter sp.]